MSVESRFIRKAWYVILDNILDHIGILQDEAPEYFELLSDNALSAIDHHPIQSNNASFNDEIEDTWFRVGIPYHNNHLKLNYDHVLSINQGYREAVAALIALHTFENLSKKEKKKVKKKDRISSIVQTNSKVDRKVFRKMQENVSKGLALDLTQKTIEFTKVDITINKFEGLSLIDFALTLLNQKKSRNNQDEDDIKALELIRDLFNSNYTIRDAVGNEYESIWNAQTKMWRSEIPKKIANSKWFCFRRTDAQKTRENSYGISISPIEIKSWSKIKNSIQMTSKTGGDEECIYSGLVTVDESKKDLIIEMQQDKRYTDQSTTAFFVMHLATEKNQKLMVGYLLYYSFLSKRYLTKVCVWLKMDQFYPTFFTHNKEKLPERVNFKDFAIELNPVDHAEQFKEIPIDIRKFLSDRKLNRLTLPHIHISDLDGKEHSLSRWLKPKYEKADDAILKACCGTYEVCYYYGKPKIINEMKDDQILTFVRVDELQLWFDENSTAFHAQYIHSRDTKKVVYYGTASKTSSTVEFVLEAKDEIKHKTTNINIIYLSFTIPSTDPATIDNEMLLNTYFEGIISGLSDTTLTPVSFITIFHKLKVGEVVPNKYNVDNTGAQMILEFFRSNLDQIRIQLDPFGSNKRAGELSLLLSSNGYLSAYNKSAKKLEIMDSDKELIYTSPTEFTNPNRAYIAAESFIRELFK